MYKKLTVLILTLLFSVGSVLAGEITLQWTRNTEPNVKEYKAFQRTEAEPDYDYNNPAATKQDVDCEQVEPGKCETGVIVDDQDILYFVVRVYDDVGRPSGDSNEVVFNPALGPDFLSFTWLDAKIYNYPVYFGTTDKPITVNWSAYPDAIGYDYKLYDVFKEVDASVSGYVTVTTATFQLPATGSYEMIIRPMNADQTHGAWITLQGRYVGWPGGAGGIVIGRSLQNPNLGKGLPEPEKEYIDFWRYQIQEVDYKQNFLK